LIKHGGVLGHSEEEVAIIASVARYHRGSEPKVTHEAWYSIGVEDRKLVWDLAAILRLAEALDRSHKQVIKNITVVFKPPARDFARELGKDTGKDQNKDGGRDALRDSGKDLVKDSGKDSAKYFLKDLPRESGFEPGRDSGKDAGKEREGIGAVTLVLTLHDGQTCLPELWALNEKKGFFEDHFGVKVEAVVDNTSDLIRANHTK
jgi:hypothetical protein